MMDQRIKAKIDRRNPTGRALAELIQANKLSEGAEVAVLAALRYANTLLIGVELDEAEIALCVAAGKAALSREG